MIPTRMNGYMCAVCVCTIVISRNINNGPCSIVSIIIMDYKLFFYFIRNCCHI
ncbi:hypothetical protein BDC45DRAFT_523760 [Circinella umbellata]|nr:hypothetical protein BDC45DRAFT_523760 [Circinella umbellata]